MILVLNEGNELWSRGKASCLAWDLFATVNSLSHFHLCLFMHLVLLILFMRNPDPQRNPTCELSVLNTGGYKASVVGLMESYHPYKNTHQALVQSQCT